MPARQAAGGGPCKPFDRMPDPPRSSQDTVVIPVTPLAERRPSGIGSDDLSEILAINSRPAAEGSAQDSESQLGISRIIWFTRGSCSRDTCLRIVALPFCHVSLKTSKPKSRKYPTFLATAGDDLRKKRLDLGLEQRAVASLLRVSTSSVINWELGHTPVEVAVYPYLIDFLGYNPLPEPVTRGQAVSRERISRGLSVKRLARLVGIDEATIRRLEADTPRMTKRSLAKLCNYMGVDEE
jgi:transcriptional regulator with XRE-family HTH domain